MSLSDNDQDDVFIRHFEKQKLNKPQSNIHFEAKAKESDKSSPYVSWPILLAVIPTLGGFFAGNAEIWSDFLMLSLILFYVYKWMTVPWAYYESARTRRLIHQHSSNENSAANGASKEDEENKRRIEQEKQKRKLITAELRRHELAGLIWVVLSPVFAGYSLQYSRYLLSNVDRYISSFNVTVFVLAASIKPITHIINLLNERTLFLQSEANTSETQVEALQSKVDNLEKELSGLRTAFATKKDLGQVTEDINPTLQQLAKVLKRFEKRDVALRTWSEEQFGAIDAKIREFDQYICYRIEQDQRQQAHGMVVSLILLPFNVSLWAAKRMTNLLPNQQQEPKHLLTSSPSNVSPPNSNRSKSSEMSYSNDSNISTSAH